MGEDPMDENQKSSNLRALAHGTGVVLALILGCVYFGGGLKFLFVGGAKDGLGVVMWLLGSLAALSLLPLAILSIFRPRLAARGILTSYVILLAAGTAEAVRMKSRLYLSGSNIAGALVFSLLPPCLIAMLLLYPFGSRDAAAAPPWRWFGGLADRIVSAGRRQHARWAAVALGVLAGVWRFPLGVHLTSESLRLGYWLQSLGEMAMSLAFLPLSALAIFKPRLAAYAAAVSLASGLLCPLSLLRPPHLSLEGLMTTLLLNLLFGLPLVLLTGLLFYASSDGRSLESAHRTGR